jgi:hypothetical protein
MGIHLSGFGCVIPSIRTWPGGHGILTTMARISKAFWLFVVLVIGCGHHGERPMADKRDALIGTWKTDMQDASALQQYGETTLEFHEDGNLLYKIHQNGKDQIMLLTFQVEPGFIVTNQASHPRPEKTAYEITKDGKLILEFGGQKSLYQRIQ